MADFDVAVIGSGPGGYVAALRAAQLGQTVCVVERDALGGVCLNRGCIPTKALTHSAEVFEQARDGADIGIQAEGLSLDFAQMMTAKDKVVEKLTGGVGFLLKRANVDVIEGTGRLAGRGEIAVALNDGGERTIEAEKIVLATGSEPARPSWIDFSNDRVMTSDEALELTELPESVLILGGGYIGCEFAAIFAMLGAQVTVVEMLDSLLPLMDSDVGAEVTKALKKRKVKILTGTKLKSLDASEDGIQAEVEDGTTLEADKALVCVGRRLLSEELGLEDVGVEVEDHAIQIDEHCQTSVAGIYAIGDVTGKMLLAHVASAQAMVAAEHAAGQEATIDYRCVPAAVFTKPEVGTVGMTEAEAQEAGLNAKTGSFPLQALGRAIAIGQASGFVKIVADQDTGQVLGMHMVGAHASDVIAEGAMAVSLEATVTEVARTIHTHPTMAEAVMEAARSWLGQDIHA
jgi:dihydrolipoamide dehydrogenase